MQFPLRHITRLMTRRSRSGQSIILVAFMFIVLIAFVGIATDVAMLFVRYSTLRRAVDAAAIAAAGQVRESAGYLTLNAVARQFIQIHGIDANTVKIDTCETEQLALINTNTPALSAADALNTLVAPSHNPPSELCKRSPQKLIRVTAQIASPTAFLSMLGWKSVTLEASSVAQTAVLDVALVLDTSLSETYDTYNHESNLTKYPCKFIDTNPNQGDPPVSNPNYGQDTTDDLTCSGARMSSSNRAALKDFRDFTNPSPYVSSGGIANLLANPDKSNPDTYWGLGLDPYGAAAPKDSVHNDLHMNTGNPNNVIPIRAECWALPWNTNPSPNNWANYAWAGCCNDPTTQSDDVDAGGNPVTGYQGTPHGVYDSGGASNLAALRTPANVTGLNPDPNWYVYDDPNLNLPESVIMISGKNPYAPSSNAAKVLSGNPDGNKSDLICRPFKDVRDAARRFIRRMDFVRGDRIFLVTFDSQAKVLAPYGSSVQVITNKSTAISTLNEQVGVEVSPANIQLGCQSRSTPLQYVPGFTPPELPPIPPGTTASGTYTQSSYFVNANQYKNVQSYWTVAQCPDTNTGGGILAATAAIVNPNWIRRESVWVMIVLSDGYPNRTPPVAGTDVASDIFSAERDFAQVTGPGMPMPLYQGGDTALINQYCVGAPGDPTNPNYGLAPQVCTTDQQKGMSGVNPDYPWGLSVQANGVAMANSKGSFGFCPWWTFCDLFSDDTTVHEYPYAKPAVDDADPYSQLTQCKENNPRGIWMPPVSTLKWPAGIPTRTAGTWIVNEPDAPYCTDTDPNARHSCVDGQGKINPGTAASGPNQGPAEESPNPSTYYCDSHYDATDYARDRADFAGLINYMDRSSSTNNPPKKGNFIAIYSIFFDHSTKATLDENILGIKFMRYLADVGDNGVIDNHLQRWYRDVRDGVITKDQFGVDYPGQAWTNPPTGRDEAAGTGVQTGTTFPGSFASGTQKVPPPNGRGQPVPPKYDGSDPVWAAAFGYTGMEDPCAQYDYSEITDPNTHTKPLLPYVGAPPVPANDPYEAAAKTDCGQYFYASDIFKVNQAFIEIASRLFTRLSR